MRTRFLTPCLIVGFALTTAYADQTSANRSSPTAELGFLEAGHDYIIRFAENSQLFKTSKSGVTSTSYTTDDGEKRAGKPAAWTMTLTVNIFHVVKFGGGSWVLLEHPSSPDDFAKWTGKRRAMAQLTGQYVAKLEADPNGADRLKKLREAASRELPTTTTWVNLDHAVAITDVPTEPVAIELSVESIDIQGQE